MWGRGRFSTLEDSWLYISMWGFGSFAAVTQRLSKTFRHRKCFSTPPPLLSTLLFTTHSPSSPHGQPEEAMEASTRSWGACPGCHSCPQLLRETCCVLWCQASNNRRHHLEPGETQTRWYGGQWSSRALGHMSCTFLFIPSTGLHSTYISGIRWSFF